MAKVKMGPVQWFGGKGKIAHLLVSHIPYSRIYVEPYGGAGSMFMHRKPSPMEIYNDLDGRLVNLFRVLQCPDLHARLNAKLQYTPYSRDEFAYAIEILKSRPLLYLPYPCVDSAWAFFVAQNQGFAGKANGLGDWGLSQTGNNGAMVSCSRYLSRIANIPTWHSRFKKVTIDHRDALQVIRYWDAPDATFYLDPPYLASTRTSSSDYAYEADDHHHLELVQTLLSLKGNAVLSCYFNEIYQPLVDAGWQRLDIETLAHSSGAVSNKKGQLRPKRTETILVKPYAIRNLFTNC